MERWSTWSSIPGSSTHKGEIVWWHVVLIVLAALSFAFAALGAWARAMLSVGLVISALAMLVGMLSLGAFAGTDCRRGRNRKSSLHAQAQRHLRIRRTATE